jgi:hypothetical protein
MEPSLISAPMLSITGCHAAFHSSSDSEPETAMFIPPRCPSSEHSAQLAA